MPRKAHKIKTIPIPIRLSEKMIEAIDIGIVFIL
jgi:hypothetical protein